MPQYTIRISFVSLNFIDNLRSFLPLLKTALLALQSLLKACVYRIGSSSVDIWAALTLLYRPREIYEKSFIAMYQGSYILNPSVALKPPMDEYFRGAHVPPAMTMEESRRLISILTTITSKLFRYFQRKIGTIWRNSVYRSYLIMTTHRAQDVASEASGFLSTPYRIKETYINSQPILVSAASPQWSAKFLHGLQTQ